MLFLGLVHGNCVENRAIRTVFCPRMHLECLQWVMGSWLLGACLQDIAASCSDSDGKMSWSDPYLADINVMNYTLNWLARNAITLSSDYASIPACPTPSNLINADNKKSSPVLESEASLSSDPLYSPAAKESILLQ